MPAATSAPTRRAPWRTALVAMWVVMAPFFAVATILVGLIEASFRILSIYGLIVGFAFSVIATAGIIELVHFAWRNGWPRGLRRLYANRTEPDPFAGAPEETSP